MDKYLFTTMFDEDKTKKEKDNQKDLLDQEEKLSAEDTPKFSGINKNKPVLKKLF